MPLAYLKDRIIRESEQAPFMAFSVLFFWSITAVAGAAALWAYPIITQSGTLRNDVQRVEYSVFVFRFQDRLKFLDQEILKVEREKAALLAAGTPIPPIYDAQITKLRREQHMAEARLTEMFKRPPVGSEILIQQLRAL